MIIINPGSGPVTNATFHHAVDNMHHFVTDLDIPYVQTVVLSETDDDGRFSFLLYLRNRCAEVLMPGLALERVRFMKNPGQDVWQFPRLYIDGGSWLWCFAVDIVRETLLGTEDE